MERENLWQRLRWVWHYRYFLRMFVYQRIKVQYAGAILGILWSLVNPLLMTVVYTVVFTFIARQNSIENYPVFVLAGLLPWHFFTAALSGATASLVASGHLLQKVSFPSELVPLSAVLSQLPTLLGGLIVFIALALVSGVPLTGWLLMTPLLVLLEILFVVGLGLVLATANVFYRDVNAALQIVFQAWFFLTPIFYSLEIFPQYVTLWGVRLDFWRWMRILNPLASLVEAYRDALYWGRPTDPAFFLRMTLTVVAILAIGYLIFMRYCWRFAEEI